MELNLIDQLTLLALDDEKGTFVADSTAYTYAITGAIIMELALEERIDLSGEKVVVKDQTKTGDKIIDTYFATIIESEKERKIKSWVDRFGNKANKIQRDTIDKLIKNRILEKREDKILWIFSYNKYLAHNPRPENKLRRRLYDIIVNSHRPELKEIMLLNLIESCSLGKEVFGKEQVKTFKNKLKSINEYDHLGDAVNKSVKEICDAINAMLVIMISTTVVINS
jgi:Golgi phosphoprotein 3